MRVQPAQHGLKMPGVAAGWSVTGLQPAGLQDFLCRLRCGSLCTGPRPFGRWRDRELPALGWKFRVQGCKSGEGERVLTSRKHWLWNGAVPSLLFFPLFSCFTDLQTDNAVSGNCCALFSWLHQRGWILRICRCHHRPSVAYPSACWSVQPLLLPVWAWFPWSGEGSPNPLPKQQEGLLGCGCRALSPTALGRIGDVPS